MSQSPLAPPPQTGQPIDSWLYLLWRRLTATGQMLWSSIVPGSSADVAAVVTDETGSPGSLVFSGNPTLQGLTVEDAGFTSRGITDNATATAVTIDSSGNVGLGSAPLFSRRFLIAGVDGNVTFDFLRTNAPTSTQSVCGVSAYATDGTLNFAAGTINWRASENWSSTNHGMDLQFRLTASGSSKTLAEVMRIKGDGTTYLAGAEATPALKVTPVASQARWIEVTGATSSANPSLGVSGGTLDITTSVAITGVVSTSGYTVATLPAGTVGQRAYVTDALAPAYGVAVAGGGAATVPVFYNGAAWICA